MHPPPLLVEFWCHIYSYPASIRPISIVGYHCTTTIRKRIVSATTFSCTLVREELSRFLAHFLHNRSVHSSSDTALSQPPHRSSCTSLSSPALVSYTLIPLPTKFYSTFDLMVTKKSHNQCLNDCLELMSFRGSKVLFLVLTQLRLDSTWITTFSLSIHANLSLITHTPIQPFPLAQN